MLSQEEILRNTRTVARGLDALREENEAIKGKLLVGMDVLTPADERQLNDEKASILEKNLENIRLGLEESQVMLALASHLQNLEAENQKYKAQVRRLCQENAGIRDELDSTQQRLRKCEQDKAQLEEENEHLKFMNSIKKFDEDIPDKTENDDETHSEQQLRLSEVNTSTILQELGFGPDEENEQQTSSDYSQNDQQQILAN